MEHFTWLRLSSLNSDVGQRKVKFAHQSLGEESRRRKEASAGRALKDMAVATEKATFMPNIFRGVLKLASLAKRRYIIDWAVLAFHAPPPPLASV